ncbi:2,3-bisphosphoglycerate-dependent phosphoglycerate mutase [Streptomyces sp. NPDC102394]|uniref:2,3-bisphosphoglycerate-dependent phosphoglycerate mutase n=1 Tax=Streptomyces sp. NPDC102394 TaxID=3366167 RepID=UPI0037F96131
MSGPGDPPHGTLILLRHGQSEANAAGVFGGWADFRLSPHGEAQAADAARLIAGAGLLPDEVHTSLLHRSIRTAQIVTDRLDRSWTPVRRTWRLNERQYGALTGRSKRRMRQEAGAERYERRRRSLHAVPPPLSDDRPALLRADTRYAALPGESIPPVESFATLVARVTPYWSDVLAPSLGRRATLLVAAHGNSCGPWSPSWTGSTNRPSARSPSPPRNRSSTVWVPDCARWCRAAPTSPRTGPAPPRPRPPPRATPDERGRVRRGAVTRGRVTAPHDACAVSRSRAP